MTKPMSAIRHGDYIMAVPENGGEKGLYMVDEVEYLKNVRVRVTTNDNRSFVCSTNHPLRSNGIWRAADTYLVGDVLDGFPPSTIKSVEYIGEGTVVRITVPGANTYMAGDGTWHHNMRTQKQ